LIQPTPRRDSHFLDERIPRSSFVLLRNAERFQDTPSRGRGGGRSGMHLALEVIPNPPHVRVRVDGLAKLVWQAARRREQGEPGLFE